MSMIFVEAISGSEKIVYANASFLKLMGYEESNIIGKPFSCTIGSVQNGQTFNLKDCETDDDHHHLHYVNALKSGGQLFPAALLAAPVTDSFGKTFQYFVCFVDLSEQAAERAAEQVRLRALYRHTPGFIATTKGKEHTITFANLAFRTLVGLRSLVGQTFAEAFPEWPVHGFVQSLDRVFETERPYVGHRVAISLQRTPEGPPERRVLDFICEPILDAEEKVTGIFCEGFDLTDVEETEGQLRLLQAQFLELGRLNAMGTMAATLAHELNQPLAAIANYAAGCIALLKDSAVIDCKVHEGLEAIENATERAGHIIRRLRDMTKRASPIIELFDLSEALTESIQLVKAGSYCDVEIADISSIKAPVQADRVQVQQVMINLLKNACEAVAQQDEKQVTACILNEAGEIKLSIADNGAGITADRQKTLFSWTESEKEDGMGMGLSISRTIIESQGGKIWLQRTSDRGSEFDFTLPLARQGA
jgi:two-component system sensor kinase FixL